MRAGNWCIAIRYMVRFALAVANPITRQCLTALGAPGDQRLWRHPCASTAKIVGGTMFFSVPGGGPDSNDPGSLWKTDGTVAGTVKVADVFADSDNVVIGKVLFFLGSDEPGGADEGPSFALWKTDGSTSGTIRL